MGHCKGCAPVASAVAAIGMLIVSIVTLVLNYRNGYFSSDGIGASPSSSSTSSSFSSFSSTDSIYTPSPAPSPYIHFSPDYLSSETWSPTNLSPPSSSTFSPTTTTSSPTSTPSSFTSSSSGSDDATQGDVDWVRLAVLLSSITCLLVCLLCLCRSISESSRLAQLPAALQHSHVEIHVSRSDFHGYVVSTRA